MEFKPTTSPAEVMKLFRDNGVKMVDMRFIDFPGVWQHFTVTANRVDEECFASGFGFDGSSIRGWQGIQESDMLVIPDATTAFIDPFMEVPTGVLLCNIQDPITRQDYTRDPRNIAKKALN